MSHEFCNDKALLVTYLYGECDEAARHAVEEHLAQCLACAAEIEQLRTVRTSLLEWQAPEHVPGVRLVVPAVETADSQPPVRSRFNWTPPWWLQVAAAVLVLAAAAGLAQIEVRYGSGGLIVRTGWGKVQPVSAPNGTETPAQTEWRRELTGLERDLRQELSAIRSTAAPAQNISDRASPPSLASNETVLMRRVQALIDQSEQRQQRELAQRLAEVVRDIDVQRRADLRGFQQTFGQLEGQTGVAVRQNQELFNYLVRVSQQQR